MPPGRTDFPKTALVFAFLTLLAVLLGFAEIAQAHRVTVFAWVEGDTVYTQSRFSGGKKVRHGKISVYDPKGNLLLTGETDPAGEFHFKRPQAGDLRIVLDAGMGHGNEWVLSADDTAPATRAKTSPEKDQAPASPEVQAEYRKPPGTAVTPSVLLSRQDIKAIVDESLDNKMKPLTKMIAELRNDKPSVHDILSGLGYILGLVGLGAYIHYRKKR